MLRSLQVRNFAIVDEVTTEFDLGMSALTGETGAGKSILVDALGLVLGDRGSSGLVRAGASRAELAAEFDIANLPNVSGWLEQQALDDDGECIVRRVIGSDGRSRSFINANPVSLQNLKALGELLLDIHGQHFHQSLTRPDIQRDILDHHGNLAKQAARLATLFDSWQTLQNELQHLQQAQDDRESRLELLQYQVRELELLDIQPGELDALESERNKLLNSGRIADGLAAALSVLFDAEAGNAQAQVGDALRRLAALAELDPALNATLELLQVAAIQLDEAHDALRRYADQLDMDPARRDWVEERLDAIQAAARKHRVEPAALATFGGDLAKDLHNLQHAEEHTTELIARVAEALTAYDDCAGKLSRARSKAARSFAGQVTEAMHSLGMPGGKFEVAVHPADPAQPRRYGMDIVEFMISANPGQATQSLAKVASGGELSRMSLAIQVIAADGSEIPTMIFDEIDSGVGGGVAEMVGRRLAELGHRRQVLCVTHLPQVASQANQHFRVLKMSDGKTTRTAVNLLTNDERVEELARMLGGVKITKRTREHAAEMLRTGRTRKAAKARA